jgi:hypothetical protein
LEYKKLEPTELSTMLALLDRTKKTDDKFAHESMNQYMEDLGRKYKVAWGFVKINMETGEIVPRDNKEKP